MMKKVVWLTGTAAVSQEGDDCRLSILRNGELRCCRCFLANCWRLRGLDVGWGHPRPKFLLPGHLGGCEAVVLSAGVLSAGDDRLYAVAALASAATT